MAAAAWLPLNWCSDCDMAPKHVYILSKTAFFIQLMSQAPSILSLRKLSQAQMWYSLKKAVYKVLLLRALMRALEPALRATMHG